MLICYNEKKCINKGFRYIVSGSLFFFLDIYILTFFGYPNIIYLSDIQKIKRGGNYARKTEIRRQ